MLSLLIEWHFMFPCVYFQVFLGQRYGFRPLPSCIPEEEMKLILQAVPEEEDRIIHDWYKIDTNAVPPQYVLQPIDRDMHLYELEEETKDGEEDPFDYVKAYLNKEKDEEEKEQKKIKEARKRWAEAEKILAATIRKAVDVCLQNNSMETSTARKYFWSGM